ncbi:MAG: hypothetical protein PUK63_01935 [Clostridiales bacterium]|nr:hypothetical protein [Clostridiales bacterium]MDY3061124.1 hypothetical protein [Eubacteriales bacterium]
MGINAGANAITGVYLGDQLLTKGGGDVESIIQSAIDKPDAVILGQLLASPDQILSNSTAMTALANSEAAMDLIVPTGLLAGALADYPVAQSIYYNSPYIGKYPPGRATLAKGTQSCGYYGEIPSTDFGIFTEGSQIGKTLTASTLAAALSITNGIVMNENATWHKFNWENQIWYIASRPIRRNISFNTLKAKKAVNGGATISTTRGKFSPALLTSGNKFSRNISVQENTMWDKLLRSLEAGRYWERHYAASDFGFGATDAMIQWAITDLVTGVMSVRHGADGEIADGRDADSESSYYGWRPALRFVP